MIKDHCFNCDAMGSDVRVIDNIPLCSRCSQCARCGEQCMKLHTCACPKYTGQHEDIVFCSENCMYLAHPDDYPEPDFLDPEEGMEDAD